MCMVYIVQRNAYLQVLSGQSKNNKDNKTIKDSDSNTYTTLLATVIPYASAKSSHTLLKAYINAIQYILPALNLIPEHALTAHGLVLNCLLCMTAFTAVSFPLKMILISFKSVASYLSLTTQPTMKGQK